MHDFHELHTGISHEDQQPAYRPACSKLAKRARDILRKSFILFEGKVVKKKNGPGEASYAEAP